MWWQELVTLQQVCFIIGCATLAFMIVQIIFMLIGFSDDDAFSGEVGADLEVDVINNEGIANFGLRLISVRTVIAFLCLGSFAVFFTEYYLPTWASLLIGVGIGGVAGFLMALAINAISKMQSSGNIDVKNCVGKVGEVYLTIPPSRTSRGKVNLLVQERYAEFEAVTDSDSPLKTGSQVKVVSVVSENLLAVEPLVVKKSEIQ